MIESSIIKLVLIVILNMCFVWVWVKKENLRRNMPFKIIRKLEEKVSFKKIKKLISFIGNINIFWILNISYFLLIKFFEKELNLILGFSEGATKDLMIESNILKSSYIYANSLGGVTKFIFDSGNFIGLFIGVTALMIPIYLYIIGFKSKSKRQLLLMLTKKGDMFYISFFIYIMLFFKVEKLFLVGAIGYLIFLLMEAVKWIMRIENSLYSFKGLGKILKFQVEDEIIELYNATLNELYQGVKDNDTSATDENKKLLLLLLRENIIKIKNTKYKVNTKNLIGTLYDIYDVAIKNQDDDVFGEISYAHIKIADYYLKNGDQDRFCSALMVMTKKYDYYHKDGTDKFESVVVSGFISNCFGILKTYKENIEEGIEWYSQIFKAINEGVKKAFENNDFYFFKQFIYLIGHQFEYKDDLKRDYKLLEKSVYFGVLMYLKEEKRKLENNEDGLKKMDEYIEFMKKEMLKNIDLIDLIELYVFIGEEIYGYNEQSMNDRLDWDGYFRIKPELIRIKFQEVRGEDEKIKLFFGLLGGIEFEEWEENKLLDEKELQEYIKDKLDSEESFNHNKKQENKEVEIEQIMKRIATFREKASWLLNDLKKYKSKEKIVFLEENYKKVEDLLIKFKNNVEQKEKEKIRGLEVSLDKIEIMKEVLENILSNSKVIKMLNKFGKYKDRTKSEENLFKIELFGINRYMEKEYFVKIGNEGGTKAIAKSFGQAQNRLIEQIIVNKLEMEKQEIGSIEKALNSIKGKPWIILTRIDMFSFFYAKNDSTIGKILVDSDLKGEESEKYGEILEGMYKYKGTKIPIYNFSSDKKGIYILDSEDIEGFFHYDPREKIEEKKNIGKEFNIDYARLKITDTKDIIATDGKENVLKYEFLRGDETPEEKLEKFRQRVLVSFVQKGELKLRKDALVYKVEFNG